MCYFGIRIMVRRSACAKGGCSERGVAGEGDQSILTHVQLDLGSIHRDPMRIELLWIRVEMFTSILLR